MTFHVQDDAVDATGAEMQLFTDFSHSHGTCAQAGDNAVPILESQSIHGHPLPKKKSPHRCGLVRGTKHDAIPGLLGIVLPGKDLTKQTRTDSLCLIAFYRTAVHRLAQAKIITFFNTLTIRGWTDLC